MWRARAGGLNTKRLTLALMQSHADLICRSQTSHTPPHTLRTSLASRPIRRPVSGNQSAGKPVINGSAFEGRPREPICRGRGAGVGTRARRGRGRARPRGAPRGGHARGGGGGSRERDWEARGVAPAARARSARSAQLGDDEGDHAARSASRGQEPTPGARSPPGDVQEHRAGWRRATSLQDAQDGEVVAGRRAPQADGRRELPRQRAGERKTAAQRRRRRRRRAWASGLDLARDAVQLD